MKKLHHPGTPCKIVTQKNYSLSEIQGNNLELVKCSDGWGLFGKEEYWISDEEKKILEKRGHIKQFISENMEIKDWGFYSPINLEIEITKSCNQRCIHCWNESGNGPLFNFSKLEEIVDEFRANGGQRLKLTGGEPLSYKYFFDFIRNSKEKGIRNIEITTNGSLINKKNIENLSKYVDKLNISLHGATKEMHNEITKSNNYQKTRKAILLCNDYGLNPTINFTVMQENKSELESLFKLFQNQKNKLRFNLLMQRGSGKRLEDISSEVFQLRKEINSLAQLYQVRIERSGLYPQGYNKGIESAKFYGCSALRTGMYVSSEGLVFPCNLANNPIGNVYKNSISDIWKSENSQKIRDITSCKETSCDIACGGKCKAKEI